MCLQQIESLDFYNKFDEIQNGHAVAGCVQSWHIRPFDPEARFSTKDRLV